MEIRYTFYERVFDYPINEVAKEQCAFYIAGKQVDDIDKFLEEHKEEVREYFRQEAFEEFEYFWGLK